MIQTALVEVGADYADTANDIGCAVADLVIACHEVKIVPILLIGRFEDTLGTQHEAVVSLAKFLQQLRQGFGSAGARSFQTPADKYFVCIVVYVVVTATFVLFLMVMMTAAVLVVFFVVMMVATAIMIFIMVMVASVVLVVVSAATLVFFFVVVMMTAAALMIFIMMMVALVVLVVVLAATLVFFFVVVMVALVVLVVVMTAATLVFFFVVVMATALVIVMTATAIVVFIVVTATAIVIVIVVMMVMMFLGCRAYLLHQYVHQMTVRLERCQQLGAIQLLQRGGDKVGVIVERTHQFDSGLQFGRTCQVPFADNQGIGLLDLILVELAKVEHIHTALGGIYHGGNDIQLQGTKALDRIDDIRQLAHTGRLDDDAVGVESLDDFL